MPGKSAQSVKDELRRRYAALGSQRSFEEAVAKISLGDLEYLMTDANQVKLTYLADLGSTPKGSQLRTWVAAGVIAGLARRAIRAGYSAESLVGLASLAAGMGGSQSFDSWLELLVNEPTDESYLRGLATRKYDGHWLEVGIRTHASFEALDALRALEVPPRFVTKEILASTDGCQEIHEWYIAGIAPQAVVKFCSAHVDVGTAVCWLRAGFTPAEAIKMIRSSLSPEDARHARPDIPFSRAFRRYNDNTFSIKGEYSFRVSEAVRAMDVPSSRASSMFGSARTQVAFLDGGYVEVEGYGFGSHTYCAVIGDSALRLICQRTGVRPPGGTATIAAQRLDQMLEDQRLRHPDDLWVQAQRPWFR